MKVRNILKNNNLIFSFEFYPPKTDDATKALLKTVEELKELNPSYVSVTYGAGGSTRDKTTDIVLTIKNKFGIEPMAHLTCVGSTKEYIRQILDKYRDAGIENILALRGDPPDGEKKFTRTKNGFAYAVELVDEIKKNYNFSIGVAGYPEGHPESDSLETDLQFLKQKVDAGADCIVTQIFFDNNDFFKFEEKARNIGIDVPIIPGIMPILNYKQIKKITEMCGSKIPPHVDVEIEKIKNIDSEVEQFGTEYAYQQCKELIQRGVPGIHFYTLNKSNATLAIMRRLQKENGN